MSKSFSIRVRVLSLSGLTPNTRHTTKNIPITFLYVRSTNPMVLLFNERYLEKAFFLSEYVCVCVYMLLLFKGSDGY